MHEWLHNHLDAPSFLNWWNENPIIFGGDRFSAFPGLAIHYIQHTDPSMFELKIEPIQWDKPEFTQIFLGKLLEGDDKHYIDLLVKDGEQILAKATLQVVEGRQYALGEGEWLCFSDELSQWRLEYTAH